jgi:hypothetical protein
LLPFNENMVHNMLALILDPTSHNTYINYNITNFMGHDLAIIIMQNLFFIGLYGIDMDFIHLFVLFEHRFRAHCLDTNDICLFILFKYKCYMIFYVFYTQRSCTWLLCLNNAWHLRLSNTNLWNNIFRQIWNKPMKLVSLGWMIESWVKDIR